MGVRKNYRTLTPAERERFVQAVQHVKSTGFLDQFAAIHERHFFHGIHRSSHFLPWHREMLLRFERALQEHDPEVTIPYWDSTVDRSPSDPLWNDDFLGQFDAAWDLDRALGSGPLSTAADVQVNQGRDNYNDFWRELERPIHNRPHVWVGGVMAGAASPGDPVFYLHHGWIDMLWAQWQLTHPGVPFVSSGPGLGLDDPLMEWPDRTPAQVMDHHALGYTYDTEAPPVFVSGKLLFYRDANQNGTGDVNSPSVIGQGGWQDFKFLFSGGNGIIYAVNPDGQLLFYRDTTQDGTGDVNTPSVIGQGGWQDFKFLFSGGNGIIYAVNPDGQLLFYRDATQDGTGDVNTPSVIGQGGWQDFKFLAAGGNGIIYAVDPDGQLLFYRDATQDGTGDVNTPSVIGQGGWQDFKFLAAGGNGIIYAVDQAGQLLFYRDATQDGTGDVNTPSVIGLGGWQVFKFLAAGGNGIIYAAVA
jgi:hypothetical protein